MRRGWQKRAVQWGMLLMCWFSSVAAAWAASDGFTRGGRMAQSQGGAWLSPSETSREWLPVQRNDAVADGDRLRTDAASWLELQVGSSSLWLGPQSEILLTQLDEVLTEVSLVRGSLLLRVRETSQVRGWRILTEEGSAAPEATGLYRIDRTERNRRTTLRSFQGELRFLTRDNLAYLHVYNGKQAECWQDAGTTHSSCRGLDRPGDEWDRFAQDRLSQEGAGSPLGVSPEITGVQELETYGRWDDHPDYGAVWAPTRVRSDWEPYRFGSWSWVNRWGWTWVDDAPWGFAPFHYGRWLRWQGRWVWWPGHRHHRPAWVPAAVQWNTPPAPPIHPRTHSPGGPTSGWKPLAPHDTPTPGTPHPSQPLTRPEPAPPITAPIRPAPRLNAAPRLQAVDEQPPRPLPSRPEPVRPEPSIRLNAPPRVNDVEAPSRPTPTPTRAEPTSPPRPTVRLNEPPRVRTDDADTSSPPHRRKEPHSEHRSPTSSPTTMADPPRQREHDPERKHRTEPRNNPPPPSPEPQNERKHHPARH